MNKDIINESLKSATPYMLRNDGKLLECGLLHPYFKYDIYKSDKAEIQRLINTDFQFVDWFYNNTQYDTTKRDITTFLTLIYFSDEYSIDDKSKLEPYIDKECSQLGASVFDIEQLYEELNNTTNQEFCRVRTSSMRFGGNSNDIYFRISSVGFNWFNLIWKIVYENKSWISDVTICTDTQVKGKLDFYLINGKKLNRLNIEEFISLPGNPIIENYKFELNNTKCLIEQFGDIHPAHINNIYEVYAMNENLKDDLKKHKKFANKHSKGLSPFTNSCAGNVEKNTEIFNNIANATSDIGTTGSGEGTAMGEALEDIHRYMYQGPVTWMGKYYGEVKEPIYTEAKTEAEAINHLEYKVKMMFGFKRDQRVKLKNSLVKEVTPFDRGIENDPAYRKAIKDMYDDDVNIKNCYTCGATLSDEGKCPYCDYGDESVFDENLAESFDLLLGDY